MSARWTPCVAMAFLLLTALRVLASGLQPCNERAFVNASVHLIGRVAPATVGLMAEIPESHPSAAILGTERRGTGTIVDPDGLILTVNYVLLGAEHVEVTTLDGEIYTGQVVAKEFTSGLALVKIDCQTLCPTVTPHSSAEAKVGDEVFIIASVGGAERRGNNGAITSLSPFDAYWEYRLERAIITTAVNPGVGGAPLFDSHGNMIGIVALDLGEIGRFTLAIPAEEFLDHREELLRFGRRAQSPSRAWIGFYCYAQQDHVVIAGVFPGAPADTAGLRPGDVILAVNGEQVTARGQLYSCLWTHRPGDQMVFSVFRNEEVKRIEVASASAEKFFA